MKNKLALLLKRIADALGKTNAFVSEQIKKSPLIALFCVALFVNCVLESLLARSVFGFISSFIASPPTFLLNVGIIMLTFAICLVFTKKTVAMLIVFAAWIVLGVANFVVLGYRASPITAIDIILLRSVFSVMYIYFTPFELCALVVGIAAFIALVVFLWKKVPRVPVKATKKLAVLLAVVICFVGFGPKVIADSENVTFSNMYESYGENGFAFSFVSTFFDRGIDKPEDYSPEVMSVIYDRLEEQKPEAPEEKVNIIFVQLESFFDPYRLAGAEYSEDPTPNFRRLKEGYPSGLITVPVLGAGTANTEFEVLTSISTALFGAGEYPYDTIMREKFCENAAHALKALGYRATAIHNNAGDFYDRDIIFDNMGFDDFISIEDMGEVETTPLGWAKDAVLTESTLRALDATEESDFVFVISVQPHGKYIDERKMGEDALISVTDIPNEDEKTGYEYYLSQLYECDAFVGELVEALEARDEKTVCVFYGDHLPSFDWEDGSLTDGTLYDSEYVIWSNFETGIQNGKGVTCYELAPFVLNSLGVDGGTMSRLYAAHKNSGEYEELMHLIAYDKLYGESAVEAKNARSSEK